MVKERGFQFAADVAENMPLWYIALGHENAEAKELIELFSEHGFKTNAFENAEEEE